ncbi:hypothetical protein [Bellilinea caldifistulae]|uniref:hypothetical protein n=1 Tax=Bellilinea caldifistulae TaxID=360411 RepID=UPI0014707F8B|nr:hypothetical protein [Bellilinea caldifistulae]
MKEISSTDLYEVFIACAAGCQRRDASESTNARKGINTPPPPAPPQNRRSDFLLGGGGSPNQLPLPAASDRRREGDAFNHTAQSTTPFPQSKLLPKPAVAMCPAPRRLPASEQKACVKTSPAPNGVYGRTYALTAAWVRIAASSIPAVNSV